MGRGREGWEEGGKERKAEKGEGGIDLDIGPGTPSY